MSENWNKTPDKFKDVFKLQSRYNRITAKKEGMTMAYPNGKLSEEKVFKDPVHRYVHVRDKLIWDLIGTREFQRLRRIKQLGTTYLTFHGAEHSRFNHSLGVYEIVRRMVDDVLKGVLNGMTMNANSVSAPRFCTIWDMGRFRIPLKRFFIWIMKTIRGNHSRRHRGESGSQKGGTGISAGCC